MFNTLKKVLNQIISDFYKIDIFRFSIVYIRFLFLFYILNKKKVLFNEKDDEENIITFKEKKKDNFSKEREKIQETTLEHNLIYTKNIFNLKRKYNQFLGKKTKSLISQMESLDFINKENAKILSIGPRNEGELYLIRSFGYKWSNIFAKWYNFKISNKKIQYN